MRRGEEEAEKEEEEEEEEDLLRRKIGGTDVQPKRGYPEPKENKTKHVLKCLELCNPEFVRSSGCGLIRDRPEFVRGRGCGRIRDHAAAAADE